MTLSTWDVRSGARGLGRNNGNERRTAFGNFLNRSGVAIPALGDLCVSRLFAHCFQEWGGGAIQPQEYDQMRERLHNWVLRDSCLRRNDGNWGFANVSARENRVRVSGRTPSVTPACAGAGFVTPPPAERVESCSEHLSPSRGLRVYSVAEPRKREQTSLIPDLEPQP